MKKTKKILGSFIAGVTNGIIGTGGGTVIYLTNDEGAENQKSVQCFMIMLVGVYSAAGAVLTRANNVLSINQTVILTVGCIIGSVLGCGFMKNVSGKSIRVIFALLLVTAGIKMLV